MDERIFMQRAIELAASATHTYPNPRVGAVVVRDGEIVGEGLHEGAGTPHAEPQALEGIDATGATFYVSLEPCNHEGRMPPCAPAIAAAGVTRVVAAMEDPDPRVRGRGIAFLRAAGVDVSVGLLQAEAEALNAPWLHRMRTGRPYLSLKLALTIDGRLAAADGTSRWISDAAARDVVQRRRAETDAILVGAGTVIHDDPSLTVRLPGIDRQPLRVVVDASGRVAPSARLFGEPGEVLIATTTLASHETQLAWKDAGAEVAVLPGSGNGVDLGELLDHLARRDVVEVLCEGGAELASSLLRSDSVDRLEIHRGPLLLGSGAALHDLGVETMNDARRWRHVDTQVLDDTVVSCYERRS